jgi:hypothetical protein
LALLADDARAPLGFAVVAGFVATLGLLWRRANGFVGRLVGRLFRRGIIQIYQSPAQEEFGTAFQRVREKLERDGEIAIGAGNGIKFVWIPLPYAG